MGGFFDVFRKLWGWLSSPSVTVYARSGTWAVQTRTGVWLHNTPRTSTWAVQTRTADWLHPPAA